MKNRRMKNRRMKNLGMAHMNGRLALMPLLAGACLLTLSGCRTETPTALTPTALSAMLAAAASPTPAVGAELRVSCTPAGVSVIGASVAAGRAGVRIRVSATAARGTYLNFVWTGGGGGGAPAPTFATTWTLKAPPGQLRLSCSTESKESPTRMVTVVDPGGYWRATTLADLGCTGGSVLDWAAGPGRGTTEKAAVNNLVEQTRKRGGGSLTTSVTVKRADVGYSDLASETWLVSRAGRPYMSVNVMKDKEGFAAYADALC
jgi:hypothetical protein